jgi:nitrate reductase delta subunit
MYAVNRSGGGRDVADVSRNQRIYMLFAAILEYPGPNLHDLVNESVTLLTSVNGGAAERMEVFGTFIGETAPVRIEEIYTRTFDLQPVCYPYAGYQLFGESYKRGAFMVKLKERYRARGFSVENELPDHIPVILRFLSTLPDAGQEAALVTECLIPALTKMARAFADGGTPYGDVIGALQLFLQPEEDAVVEGERGMSHE